MIIGHIDNPTTYHYLLKNKIWLEALEWIKNNAHRSSEGIYKLCGDDMYVNVHGYETLPVEFCKFESHLKYIDLQYCISGGEVIAWEPISVLKADGLYDADNDLQNYMPTISCSRQTFTSGFFGVFFQEDGHQPKIADGINKRIKKLVIKINSAILETVN